MNDVVNFSGKWKGQYVYGKQFRKDAGKTVAFDMLLEDENGTLTGTFTDDETRDAFDEPGTVAGFAEGNFVSFVKKYPSTWKTDESGNVVVLHDKPSHEIHYHGDFDGTSFTGEWEIDTTAKTASGAIVDLSFFGTWSMERADQ